MKRSIIATLLILSGATAYSAAANTVDKYQKLMEKWLSLEAQERAIRQDWQTAKPLLEERMRLIKAEKALLKNKLDKSKEQQDEVAIKRTELLNQQTLLEQEQNKISQWLSMQLTDAKNQMSAYPPVLQKTWLELLSQLHDTSSNSEQLDILLALYAKREEFNNRVSYNKSKLTLENGEERLVEQLYFGVQLGYFMSSDGSLTGIGYSKNHEWRWQIKNAITPEQFTQAKAMYQNNAPADLLELPVLLEIK